MKKENTTSLVDSSARRKKLPYDKSDPSKCFVKMQNRNSIVHSHNHQPTTHRRSQRLLLQHHPNNNNPPTPNNPFNSKSNGSTKKPSNQRSPESRSKSRNCYTGLRRSPRLNNGVVGFPSLRRSPRFSNCKVSLNEQNDKKPSKDENFSGDSGNSNPGSRKSATVKKSRTQVGGAGEAKTKKNSVEHCVNDDGFGVEGKGINGDGVEVGVKRKRKRKHGGSEEEIAKGWTKEQELALQRAYFAAKPSPHFWKNVSKLVPGKSQQECFDRIHCDHITPRQSQPRSRAKTIMSSPLHQFSISASKLLKPFDKKVRRSNFLKQKNYITQKSIEKMLQGHLKVDQDHEGDVFSVLEPNIDFFTNAFQPSEALSTPKQLKENQGLLQSCTETSSSSHKKILSRFNSSCITDLVSPPVLKQVKNKPSEALSIPKQLKENQGLLQSCTETSSSSHKKILSRCSSSCITDLVSPPVLKQVKNKVLHEKYINQLRCREARRRAASARIQMPITGKILGEGTNIQKRDVVKAAKVALLSEARDAINKFQQSQVNFMGNSCSSDEDNDDGVGVEYESP